jgi:hypothetical protein
VPRGNSGTTFTKRTAFTWYTDIRAGSIIGSPAPSRLFSATNGSFFTSTSGSTTTLSFPEKTGSSSSSQGYVLLHQADPGWDELKAVFAVGTEGQTPQAASAAGFPTHYTALDAALPCCYYEATVGRTATYGSGSSRRTMVGLNLASPGRVYIFASMNFFTNAQALAILRTFSTINAAVQLDGGGSTQMWAGPPLRGFGPLDPGRTVPEVLAVYCSSSC